MCVLCVVVVPNHESSGYGQHRASSKGGSVVGDPAAHPDVDGPDDGPHQQPYLPWHDAGCQRYGRKKPRAPEILISSLVDQKLCH